METPNYADMEKQIKAVRKQMNKLVEMAQRYPRWASDASFSTNQQKFVWEKIAEINNTLDALPMYLI